MAIESESRVLRGCEPASGRAFQGRRESVRGGCPKTSLFLEPLESPPRDRLYQHSTVWRSMALN